jgi:hypothetical protein
MKTYTVKDFIKLNSPCYGCGNKVSIHVGAHMDNTIPINLNMSITSIKYVIPLSITYNNNLSLTIDPKTNRYLVTSNSDFIKYIKDHNIYLTVDCDKCYTFMASRYLEFDLAGGYIRPVSIRSQSIILFDKNNKYMINSYFLAGETTITVFSLKNGTASDLKLPLLPHYRFKNKENFIEKIKTYILFS